MKQIKPVTLSGKVIRFQGKGRQLGYPTANLTIHVDQTDGVYFGYADLAEWSHHPAIIFIGIPTTMGDRDHRLEAHLLDIPDVDYYGLPLSVHLRHYHRPNQAFDSVETLKTAMKADAAAARRWFAKQS